MKYKFNNMCEINTNIKEIIIDAIRPNDIEIFLNTFKIYYGSIIENENNTWKMICENPELYTVKINVDFWYPTMYAKDIIESLMESNRGVILYLNKIAWNISIKKEKLDLFPAPKLDPNITNEHLARKCWAPMKVNIPEHITLDLQNETSIPFMLEKEIGNGYFSEKEEDKYNYDKDELIEENEILRNEITELNKQIILIENEFNNLLKFKDNLLIDYDLILKENKYFKNLIQDIETRYKEEKNKLTNEKIYSV